MHVVSVNPCVSDGIVSQMNRVCVVVLGDVGRSPRMQYHSLSLADTGFDVDIVGYGGSRPHQRLLENQRINLYLMKDVPDVQKYIPRSLSLLFKVLWQSLSLFWTLIFLSTPGYLLLQNPPSVPTIPICWLYCRLKSVKLVIDWHNYGFSIMALTSPGWMVKIYQWIEIYFGSKADNHLCVTKAFKSDLLSRTEIPDDRITVLYDSPSNIFGSISPENSHSLFLRLSEDYEIFRSDQGTRFTYISDDGTIKFKFQRPAIVVSSTSWTPDEDFSILLEALQKYDESPSQTEIACFITGKGPLKSYYQQIISSLKFKKVDICLLWLQPEDYPRLLASADLGVCLHTSSSGLDLPMKIVDMFGSLLPVTAYFYETLKELVIEDFNGYHFRTSQELSGQLSKLFEGFPEKSQDLNKFRNNLKNEFRERRWDQNWRQKALKVFTD